MKMRLWVLGMAVLMPAAQAFAQTDKIDEFIQREMAARKIPGLALAVLQNGKVAIQRAYGLANLETETPVGTNSVFEIASMTKPFTATAIMMLVEEGKLGLDHPINRYIFQAPDPWKDITVRHLLSHTAGFPEQVIVGDGVSPLMDVSTLQQLHFIENTPPLFRAGESAQYSDPGYFLLGMIIEQVSGKTYREFVRERIFDPLGMKSSAILDQYRIVKNHVSPYMLRRGQLLKGRRDWQHELPSFFGVLSSIEDLARWESALAGGTLVKKATLDRMWTPVVLDSGLEALVYFDPYGFGWKLGDFRGHRIVEHGGFSGTHMLRFPDDGLTVIILTNLDVSSNSRPENLARGVAGIVNPALQPPQSMEPQSDPSPQATQELRTMMADFAAGRDNSLMTPECRSALSSVPPRARQDLVRLVTGLKEFLFVGSDDAAGRGLTRTGSPVSRIVYCKGRQNEQTRIYTFWLTKEGKVAYWRPFSL